MKKINVITIDGPSASGKGALARQIARKFDKDFFDGERKFGYGGYNYNEKYVKRIERQ